jgi:diacylglycerol kinase family enzyme
VRAVLIVNPTATTTTPRQCDVLVSALAAEVDLSVTHTTGRGHAAVLAREAAATGVELVVCLSGDGTINEVVNGILTATSSAELSGRSTETAPMLGIVPGGSTNVFSRALGLPRDPVEATGALLEAIRHQQSRTVGLGKIDDRWFTFCAGVGFDADVVRHVESRRRSGSRSTARLYARVAAAQYARRIRTGSPGLMLTEHDGRRHQLSMAVVQNTSPWTYLGSRPIHGSGTASFDTGLDVMGLASLAPGVLARSVIGLLRTRAPVGNGVVTLHDASTLTICADRPVAVHVDGDFIGEREIATFSAAPAALRVAMPYAQGADVMPHPELH